jgi:hypothetical protein
MVKLISGLVEKDSKELSKNANPALQNAEIA